jgi:hypothetical protein
MISSENIELLPVKEYAERFCVSRTTIFEWKKNGILIPGRHFIKIGRTLRFVWELNIIQELHESDFKKTVQDKEQPVDSVISKPTHSKMSAINMKY